MDVPRLSALFPAPVLKISHFFKKAWFLFVEENARTQGLCALVLMATRMWLFLNDINGQGKKCVRVCVCARALTLAYIQIHK
jgi:hypothetical protein